MDQVNDIAQRLERIERLLLVQKTVLTFAEALEYTGISASYMYKLTSSRTIPHFKPLGKLIYFKRVDLDAWMLSRRIKPNAEINNEAVTYLTIGRK